MTSTLCSTCFPAAHCMDKSTCHTVHKQHSTCNGRVTPSCVSRPQVCGPCLQIPEAELWTFLATNGVSGPDIKRVKLRCARRAAPAAMAEGGSPTNIPSMTPAVENSEAATVDVGKLAPLTHVRC